MNKSIIAATLMLVLFGTAGSAFAQRYDDGPGPRYYDDDRRGPPPPPRYDDDRRGPPPPPRYDGDRRGPPPSPQRYDDRRGYGGDGPRYGGGGGQICAEENGFCRFRGFANVRYGARGRYVMRQARDGIPCNNRVFGDPAPGVPKACFVD